MKEEEEHLPTAGNKETGSKFKQNFVMLKNGSRTGGGSIASTVSSELNPDRAEQSSASMPALLQSTKK
ncbi:hypothetical protein ILYODFUR_020126 [Ilyodon furcidens]|uniref:Uncharacterized protein n=1 Tax=Ilyodon furcidens TaxID=33524 RepID=A0ABV0TK50_9TELE